MGESPLQACSEVMQVDAARTEGTPLRANDQGAKGEDTCSQALLDLFKILLQALPLSIQLCVLLLQLLNSALSISIWASAQPSNPLPLRGRGRGGNCAQGHV